MSTEPAKSPQEERTPDPVIQKSRLDALARRYYAPLATFFRKRTRSAAVVPDLVQQVFLKLAQQKELGAIENTDGYIFQTASNALKDHYRHERIREQFLRSQLQPRDSDFSVERVLEGQESLSQAIAQIRNLPERTRDIFVLRVFEGIKYEEIAALLKISTRAVEKHMAKAMTRLSELSA